MKNQRQKRARLQTETEDKDEHAVDHKLPEMDPIISSKDYKFSPDGRPDHNLLVFVDGQCLPCSPHAAQAVGEAGEETI